MRNFKKVMALAVSTAALATSVSAFAATEYTVDGLNGSYDAANNALTLTVEGAAGDKTVLVLDNGVAATAATGDDILYINQYTADETAYDAMGLKGTDALAVGEYAIKIGYTDANGDFAIAEGKIVVAEGEEPGDEPVITILYGDVNYDESVTVDDASLIAQVAAGLLTFDEAKTKAADVNADSSITVDDASLVAQKAAGLLNLFPVEK